jgi:hypothetical protein
MSKGQQSEKRMLGCWCWNDLQDLKLLEGCRKAC